LLQLHNYARKVHVSYREIWFRLGFGTLDFMLELRPIYPGLPGSMCRRNRDAGGGKKPLNTLSGSKRQ
jgi:hypothetical protein